MWHVNKSYKTTIANYAQQELLTSKRNNNFNCVPFGALSTKAIGEVRMACNIRPGAPLVWGNNDSSFDH